MYQVVFILKWLSRTFWKSFMSKIPELMSFLLEFISWYNSISFWNNCSQKWVSYDVMVSTTGTPKWRIQNRNVKSIDELKYGITWLLLEGLKINSINLYSITMATSETLDVPPVFYIYTPNPKVLCELRVSTNWKFW